MKSICISCILICIYSNIIAQPNYNFEIKDKNGNAVLLGKTTRERLQQAPFDAWFISGYDGYKIDTAAANQLKPFLKNKRFLIFMGSWCGDSRREVPRMYKLLDYCGIPSSQIELVNVDYRDSVYKQSPTHEERGLNIHRVPDLLVYDKQVEIGRVVESPVISWEKDLLAILKDEGYTPKYKAVPVLASRFQQSTLREMETNLQQLTDLLRPLVQNRSELNSYGYIQMSLQETEKALLVFRLNALLFPNEPAVWDSLAQAMAKR